jgi:hypothetical protein
VVTPPADYRGCLWYYTDATPEHARVALEAHLRDWPDWPVDERLVALAEMGGA